MSLALTRRLFTAGLILAAPAASFAAAKPAPLSDEDQALVDKAVAFLQDLTRAKGRFIQTDPHGKSASGDIYLQRPGKIHFEYDPPNILTVISDGNQVEVKDGRLKTTQRTPLRATPLSLFLAKEIRLDKGVVVTKVERGEGQFTITARDGSGSAAGQLIITFGDDPMALKEWTVIDGRGQTTRIQLTSLKPVASLDPDLFRFAISRSTGHSP